MANSLLDFVMALVRDPDAAARYAADPAGALADAQLTDVTSADVQNLIPVVAESLSTGSMASGASVAAPAENVWASGAATAAFDAFDAFDLDMTSAVPDRPVIDAEPAVPVVIHDSDAPGADDSALMDLDVPASVQVDEPVIAEVGADDWVHPVADLEPGQDAPGFDVFD